MDMMRAQMSDSSAVATGAVRMPIAPARVNGVVKVTGRTPLATSAMVTPLVTGAPLTVTVVAMNSTDSRGTLTFIECRPIVVRVCRCVAWL